MTYLVKYNRKTVHIAGIAERSAARPDTADAAGYYAVSACPALSRAGSWMAVKSDSETEDLGDALETARLHARIYQLKMCKTCDAAAETVIAASERQGDARAPRDVLAEGYGRDNADDHLNGDCGDGCAERALADAYRAGWDAALAAKINEGE